MSTVQVPSVEEVGQYGPVKGKDPADVQDAYDAEKAAQAHVCRVDPYAADLAQALKRRVARNLAMRNIPLGIQMDEVGGIRVGSNDPEVRRLEAPYRKVYVG